MRKFTREVVRRHPENPILTAEAFPWRVSGVYNSGVIKHNGRYVMACRVNQMCQNTLIWLADSDDGIHFTPRPEPLPLPQEEDFQQFATHVVYDPRITYFEAEKRYFMTLAVHGHLGCRSALFVTEDWENVTFFDWLDEVDNRNMVIFPEKIDGMYGRLDRPNVPAGKGDIWISYSPDLHFWGRSDIVLKRSECGLFCASGVGPSSIPIRTDEGWLVLFHGVMMPCANTWYTLGAMLLDLGDPSKVLARAEHPIMQPDAHYERHGLVPNVVFCCAAVPEEDGAVKIYYGAGDDVQAMAESSIDELMWACKNQ